MMTTPTDTPTHSETITRLADALVDRIVLYTRAANSRPLAGPQNAARRAEHRAEVRACEALRIAILNADPLELDAVVNAR